MKTNIEKYSLYSVLILIIVLTVVIAMFTQSYIIYIGEKNERKKDIEYNSNITVELLSKNLSKSINSYAVNEYSNLIHNAMGNRYFEAIVVEDYNMAKIVGTKTYVSGKIRINHHSDVVDFDPDNVEHIQNLNNSFYKHKENILGPLGKEIGTVTIYSTDYYINLEKIQIFKRTIASAVVVSLSIILMLFIAIRYFILKPISNLIEIIQKTDNHGIPLRKLSKGSSKEIDILSDTMNKMIDSIRDSNLELKDKKIELEIFNNNLEKLVAKRTKELKQAQKHMIQTERMAALGGLVAGVAHEVNTPIGLAITAVTHFIDTTKKLKNDYESQAITQKNMEQYIESSIEIAEISYKNLIRAAEIIKSFKQISVDQTSEDKRVINIKKYVEDTIISIHSAIKQSNIDIKLNCESELEVSSYPGALAQIITNLIMNSITHAYDEGTKGVLNIDIRKEDSFLKLVYKDDGKGISEENIDKIFNPFFTTNRAKGGSGLGLNIIHNIVTELLGGTIECKSKIMQGTEFIILIPLEQ